MVVNTNGENMGKLAAIVEIADNREKAREIVNRVLKIGDQTGEKFGDILQEEIDKLEGANK